uniref:Uncharacterized protein n=1 Tax=Glossina austeni TaxID=7395 RepID=A0A1A9UWI4_GLOAU
MWDQLAKYKNNYLQKELSHLSAQEINKVEEKAMHEIQSEHRECNWMRREKVGIAKPSQYFEDRAVLSYGFDTLPKLMEDLGSDDHVTRWRAITSLPEVIINPLHAQTAITTHEIVRRCANIFVKIRLRDENPKYVEMEKLLDIFLVIALHMNGGKYILRCEPLINQFYDVIRKREESIPKVSDILSLITKDAQDVHYLQERYEAVTILAEIFGYDVCAPSYPANLWRHMEWIFEAFPHFAVDKGFFEILHTRIKNRSGKYHIFDMKCFGLLLRCPEGQKRFVAIDGIKEIYDILADTKHKLDTYEHVVYTLMTGLVGKEILWRCGELIDMLSIIIQFAKNHQEINTQLYCLQIFRILSDMPWIKRYMKKNYYKTLEHMKCDTKSNDKLRSELLYKLDREVYHVSDLRLNKRVKNTFEMDSKEESKAELETKTHFT